MIDMNYGEVINYINAVIFGTAIGYGFGKLVDYGIHLYITNGIEKDYLPKKINPVLDNKETHSLDGVVMKHLPTILL